MNECRWCGEIGLLEYSNIKDDYFCRMCLEWQDN
jgi:hypothetical protein